jgi:hypothetical protein
MATVKISALTELNAAPANDDVLAIVDTDASATKRISVTNLLTNAGGGAHTIEAKTADYTLTSGDLGKVIACDCSSGDVHITVPATSTLGAGFYCYITQSDHSTGSSYIATVQGDGANSTVISKRHAIGAKIFLEGKGAFATITNIATDVYSIDGDIGNLPGFISLVTDRVDAGNREIHFDDSSGYAYMGSSTAWDSSNYYRGKITGAQMAGNYKWYSEHTAAVTAIESALGLTGSELGSNGTRIGFGSGNSDSTLARGFGMSPKQGVWVYCGTGATPTAVECKLFDGTSASEALMTVPYIGQEDDKANYTNQVTGSYNYYGHFTNAGYPYINTDWAMGLFYAGASQSYYGEATSSAYQSGSYGSYNTNSGDLGLWGISSWGANEGRNDHQVLMVGDYESGSNTTSSEITHVPEGPSLASNNSASTPEGHLYV